MKYKQLTALLAAGLLTVSPAGQLLASEDDLQTAGSAEVNETVQDEQPEVPVEEAGEDFLDGQEADEAVDAGLANPDKPAEDKPESGSEDTGVQLEDVAGLIEDTGADVSSHEGASLEELLEKELEEENLNSKVRIPGFFVDPTKYPAANITVNTKLVYRFLRKDLKLNHAAACGVLANIQLESNFRPIALGDGGTSYGICQWHLGRFVRLMSYCKKEGLDYNTLYGQLCYLKYELETCYPSILGYLENVKNDEQGAYLAAYNFCFHFEIPDFTAERSARRGNLAKNEYFVKEKKEYRLTKEERKDLREAFEDGISDDLLVIRRDLREDPKKPEDGQEDGQTAVPEEINEEQAEAAVDAEDDILYADETQMSESPEAAELIAAQADETFNIDESAYLQEIQ